MRAPACHALLVLLTLALPARGERLEDIPRPAPGTWSTDTTHTLSASAREAVARWGEEVNAQGLGQLAVVVVETTGGHEARGYATELFNAWGIGHGGRDDGALLFVALKDRKAEIILGQGISRDADRARSDALMSEEIVPAFKRGDPEGAILAGARGLRDLLARPREASTPDLLPAPLLESKPDPAPWPWWLAGGAGVLVLGALGARRWSRRNPRCAGCGRDTLRRLDAAAADHHLTPGERREKHLGSVEYAVFQCTACSDPVLKRREPRDSLYSPCGKCQYMTCSSSTRVLRRATTRRSGQMRQALACAHCGDSQETTLELPQLAAVATTAVVAATLSESSSDFSSGSSSSDSSWSSSSDSFSSSDSGSSSSDFGGGSSSGSGSSGDW